MRRTEKGRIHLHSRKQLAFSLCISEISASRARVRILRPSLALYAFHRRRQENTFLPSIHSRRWRLRTSISVWEKGLVTPFSFPLLSFPILRRLSLPRYNATPSNPIHRCFSHPHIALLDCSTTSYWVRAPHCVSKESHICSSFYDEAIFLICCLSTKLWQDHFCSTLLITRTMSLIPPSPLSPSFSPSFPSSFSCNEI